MEVQGGPGTAFGSWGPEIGTQRGDGNQDPLRVGKTAPSLTCMCEGGEVAQTAPQAGRSAGKVEFALTEGLGTAPCTSVGKALSFHLLSF